MPFNLINERWLPVVPSGGGERRWIRPAEVAKAGDVEFAWGRADLDIATYELLIGLLCVAYPPEDDDDWRDKLGEPPSVADLDSAFAPLVPWFNLDGDGPRFMQDYEGFEGTTAQIGSLFVDGPGDNTFGDGIDLFVKSGTVTALSLPAAAISLYAFQSYTFSMKGGKTRQHHSGLRNGGPLVTLIKPVKAPSLWKALWANCAHTMGGLTALNNAASIFPWCGATVTSEAGQIFEVGHGHPLQSFFAMPRRIQLDFVHERRRCFILGTDGEMAAISYRRAPSGFLYGETWRHPLTPYRLSDKGPMAEKAPRRRMGYKDWCGALYGDQRFNEKGYGKSPASCVTGFRRATRTQRERAVIWAVGFITAKAKVVDFLEAEFPLILAVDPDVQEQLETLAHQLVNAADLVAGALRSALRNTLGAGTDKTVLEGPVESLWAETEQPFRDALRHMAAQEKPDGAAMNAACENWVKVLRRAALDAFDRAVPPESLINKRPSEQVAMIEARRGLDLMSSGFGKAGDALRQSLGLPSVQPKKKGTRGGRKAA